MADAGVMPDVAGFRALHYDPTRVDLAKVVAPPYDVYDEAERARLAGRDVHNFVHLDRPVSAGPTASADGAAPAPDPYARAAAQLEAWLAAGVLVRDGGRALYRVHQVFASSEAGRTITRRGFVAGVRLSPLGGDGLVRAHEQTQAAAKEDRRRLLSATATHTSQIMAGYSDVAGEVERLFRRTEVGPPMLEVTTDDGTLHRVWRCGDAELIGAVRHYMMPRKLYILDGHHRYETALAVQAAMAAEAPLSTYASANYVSMLLVGLDDPGLVARPTHRVLHGLPALDRARVLAEARAYFRVDRLAGAARDPARVAAALAAVGGHAPAVALVFAGDPDAHLLELDPACDPHAAGVTAHRKLARLDAIIVHQLLLPRLFGQDAAAQERADHLRYVQGADAALAELEGGRAQLTLLMRPLALDQLKLAADLGAVLPAKTTYFAPKIASGLLLQRIDRDEDLV